MATKKLETNEDELATMNEDSQLPAVHARGEVVFGGVGGEVGLGDIKLQRLQIAHGVGGLSDNFNPGDLVLDRDTLLVGRGVPLQMIILGANVYWKEYLSKERYDAGDRPGTFMHEAEVHAAGGTTKWDNGVGPTYNKAMHLQLLIRKPQDLICGSFGDLLGDGHEYCPAQTDWDKSAFNNAGTVVERMSKYGALVEVDQATGTARPKLYRGVFDVMTIQKALKSGNKAWVPSVRVTTMNPPEVVEKIEALFAPRS
jgi:hypothetical protein